MASQEHSLVGSALEVTLATVLVAVLYIVYVVHKNLQQKPALRSIAILVLGDVGRSPRMMNHALSCAENGLDTFVVGYHTSSPIRTFEGKRTVDVHLLEPPNALSKLPFLVAAPVKIALQIFGILWSLLVTIPKPPQYILVQNPPSIPTLALVSFVAWLRGSKVIIDWHNLGYTILALRLGKSHPLVKVAEWFEVTFGRTAHAHLFVTQAMHDKLSKDWNLQGLKVVLHDRPPKRFHRAFPGPMHELFISLDPHLRTHPGMSHFLPDSLPPYTTPFTEIHQTSKRKSNADNTQSGLPNPTAGRMNYLSTSTNGLSSSYSMPSLRDDRPAVLVSSTSWTPDEDFGILLDALALYEQKAKSSASAELPKLLVVVTGKGPLREKYMNEVARMCREEKWEWVRCVSLWLEAEDYPVLLGSADLGVSLHSSSSGLDLPMKVVDMFGSGSPVCALDFACLDELVKDGINGLVFKNASQFADQLETLLKGFPSQNHALQSLRKSLEVSSHRGSGEGPMPSRHDGKEGNHWEWNTWEENWNLVVRPLVRL